MFHDRARIQVQAGRGGDGSVSFRREKYVPRGGPDGGDGGRGGDVVLGADSRRRDLTGFRPNQRFRAGRGGHGSGARKHGADGADVELNVPVGTQVLDEDVLVADLAHPGARVVVARGGSGGRGNARFATPTRRAPRFAETGLPGDEAVLELRLKLLADAAFVGFPNAGKSSLLRRISNARPKVADYPFTTLAPVLGTVESGGGDQLTVADVPGLIEGASEGVGLGHEFLAHLERARLLLHVIDASDGDPVQRFHAIGRELVEYGAGLAVRPQIVVLNKVDLVEEPPPFDVNDSRVLRVVPVSAVTGAGIPELERALFELCPTAPEPPAPEERAVGEAAELADFLVYRPAGRARPSYRIMRTDRGYRVHGTPPAARDELDAALRAAGAKRGALVEVGDDVIEL